MDPHEYYEANGYFVFRNLIPSNLIDRLMKLYAENIVPSNYPFFRQNTNQYEANELNEFGYVKQAFLDIHDYKEYPDFSVSAQDITCSLEIQNALRQVTGYQSCNLMQTMLFDANTETGVHQDWWYLDSVPNGHLVAAWIALEDIEERAGRFFVLPTSADSIDFHSDTPNLSHSDWLKRIEQFFEANKSKIKAPELHKGDVLFWNSKTIHGALPTLDSSFSRKSLTAHYLPSEYKFGNLFQTKERLTYKTYNGMKFYRNQPDYSPLNKLKFGLKVFVYDSPQLLKLMRKVQSRL